MRSAARATRHAQARGAMRMQRDAGVQRAAGMVSMPMPTLMPTPMQRAAGEQLRRLGTDNAQPQWSVDDELSRRGKRQDSDKPKCDPYELGGVALPREEAEPLLARDLPGWSLVAPPQGPMCLRREWCFGEPASTLAALRQVTALATNDGHYPAVTVHAGATMLVVECTTPALQGLSYHDFALALKIEMLSL